MAKYDAYITLTTRGKQNPETFSSYELYRSDRRLVKFCEFIGNDPSGRWARIDAGGAAQSDAALLGVVIDVDKDIRWHTKEVRVDTRGRRY